MAMTFEELTATLSGGAKYKLSKVLPEDPKLRKNLLELLENVPVEKREQLIASLPEDINEMQHELFSEEDFAALFEKAKEVLTTLDGGESVNPQLFIATRTSGKFEQPWELMVVMVAADFNEDKDKHRVMKRIAQKLFADKKMPLGAVMLSEAWMAKPKEGEFDPHKRPSEYPDRQEVAIVAGKTVFGDTRMAVSQILRENEKQPLRFGPFDDVKDTVETNLLDSLFAEFAKLLKNKREKPKE